MPFLEIFGILRPSEIKFQEYQFILIACRRVIYLRFKTFIVIENMCLKSKSF